MAEGQGFWTVQRKRLARAAGVLLAALTVWSVLATLGLLPTAAAAIALALALAGNTNAPWIALALALSVSANLLLAFLAIRGWRYARDLESDMKLVAERFRAGEEPVEPWLPRPDGSLSVSNATLEQVYEQALAAAREATGPDTEVGPGWIDLTRPLIALHGWSAQAEKESRVWAVRGKAPAVFGIERRSSPFHLIRAPTWRRDPSWTDLIKQSWAVESPFSGSVMLWPRSDYEVKDGEGLWRIEYSPMTDAVRGRSSRYVLAGGKLERLGSSNRLPDKS